MQRVKTIKELSARQRDELLSTLRARFEQNRNRHKDFPWANVQAKLDSRPEKLWSLDRMEETGGEPDVVGLLVSSEFLHEGKTYLLEAVFKPGAIIDWFLGLEFKKVKLHIKSADETTFAEGYLTQSVKDRLKSVFNSSIRNFYEPGIKSRQKYKLLRALYDSIDVNQE